MVIVSALALLVLVLVLSSDVSAGTERMTPVTPASLSDQGAATISLRANCNVVID